MTPAEARIDYTKGMGKDIRETLSGAQAKLDVPQELRFYLYFATKDAAEAAARELTAETFECSVDEGAEGGQWLCLAERSLLPDEAMLDTLGARLVALATRHGGELDGWEAALPQNAWLAMATALMQCTELLEAKKYDEVLEAIPPLLSETPSRLDAAARMALAQAQAGKERYAEAIGTLRDAQGRYPDEAATLLGLLSRFQAKSGDRSAALQTLEQWQALEPKNGEVHYRKGSLSVHAGKTDEALRSLERAIGFDKDLRAVAREDEDWAPLREDATFKKLTRARFLGLF